MEKYIEELKSVLIDSGQDFEFNKGSKAEIKQLNEIYDLPSEYNQFMATSNPKNLVIEPALFQALTLYPLEKLIDMQLGYLNYNEGNITKRWNKDWFVIGDDTSDPYHFDLSKSDGSKCPIYSSMHGQGKWEPFLMASSFTQFVKILIRWISIHADDRYFTYNTKLEYKTLNLLGREKLSTSIGEIDKATQEYGNWTIDYSMDDDSILSRFIKKVIHKIKSK